MDSFWGNIFGVREDQPEVKVLLKQIPIFESLNDRELAAVERILYRRSYLPGEVIFYQGNPGVGMFIIAEGTVVIRYEPTQRILAELQVGDFFGEIALLNETPRSATALAKTPCVLLGVSRPDLLALVERNTRLGVNVLRALAQVAGQRLIRSDEQKQQLREELARLTGDPEHELAAMQDAANSALG